MSTTNEQVNGEAHDSGFVLVTVLAIMLPLLAVAMSMSTIMTGRDSGRLADMADFRALQAAESGLDECIYRIRNGTLTVGTPFTMNMGSGVSFEAYPAWLDTDGLDNDGDGDVDESDEHVVELIVRGSYRKHVRRLALYLTQQPLSAIGSAFTLLNPNVQLKLLGSTTVSGHDINIDGSLASPALDLVGIASGPLGTVAHLDSELDSSEESRVLGLGGSPSLGASTNVLDVGEAIDHFRTAADEVLLLNSYNAYSFGDASLGIAQSTFREGDVKFQNASRGAGVLVVTGDLEFANSARFDGLIVLGGSLKMASSAIIYGAVVQASTGAEISDLGGSSVAFSTEAINLASTVWTLPLTVLGWQHLANK